MKPTVIKVIKQKALREIVKALPAKRRRPHLTTVTSTVNDWIAESRQSKLDRDNSSRETIAGWAAEADI